MKLSTRGATRLQTRHPWVYRSDIVESAVGSKSPAPGSVVRVLDPRGKFLGSALYSSSSQIAIRMISHGSVDDLPALVAERIRAAIAYRKELVSDTDAYRIVFSEADFLPGLIVDRYNDVISLQILTQAMDAKPVRQAIVDTLRQEAELRPAGIVERVEARIRELEQLPPLASGLLWGEKSSTEVRMNGVRFHYDALERAEDRRVSRSARKLRRRGAIRPWRGARRLLLSGRIRAAPARGWATKCQRDGVDSSRAALEIAEQNAAPQRARAELEWIEANAFDLLNDYAAANRRYDTIVLDPPAFAKTKRDLDKALRGYKELNLRAMKMLRPGGILVTCSCSFHVSAADFLGAGRRAAATPTRGCA